MERTGAKLFGAQIRASNECVQCDLCVRNCPQKNIRLQNGKIRSGYRCMLCMRCLYGCPQRAVAHLMKSFVLKDGFCLDRIREMAEQSAGGKYGYLSMSFLWKGVYEYLNYLSLEA
jgi:ferredoxin